MGIFSRHLDNEHVVKEWFVGFEHGKELIEQIRECKRFADFRTFIYEHGLHFEFFSRIGDNNPWQPVVNLDDGLVYVHKSHEEDSLLWVPEKYTERKEEGTTGKIFRGFGERYYIAYQDGTSKVIGTGFKYPLHEEFRPGIFGDEKLYYER